MANMDTMISVKSCMNFPHPLSDFNNYHSEHNRENKALTSVLLSITQCFHPSTIERSINNKRKSIIQ